ncbi:MAG: RNA polymerase sigma-54 factor, partial [Desulfobacterales bacterium]|nr:RNA polymerase sigma-54 factor [Desulfobacterales bacterium]
MALELRQSLGLAQQLIMTPQLQQAIKLLQLSRLELVETLYEEMETNPVLEEQVPDEGEEDRKPEDDGDEPAKESQELPEVTVEEHARDDVDWENYLSEYNTGWAESPADGKEAPSFENITATKTNLSSHLTWQLNVSNLDEQQREIGTHIIGNLNDDGYLDSSVEEISESAGHPVEKVLETLRLIQNFDPVGVA